MPISTEYFRDSAIGISQARAIAEEATKALGAIIILIVGTEDEDVLTTESRQNLMLPFFMHSIAQTVMASKTQAGGPANLIRIVSGLLPSSQTTDV